MNLRDVNVLFIDDKKEAQITYGNKALKNRPVVVGAGPAGLFCALTLARNGYSPILIERGGTVEERTEKVKNFWENKIFDAKSINDSVLDSKIEEQTKGKTPKVIDTHVVVQNNSFAVGKQISQIIVACLK